MASEGLSAVSSLFTGNRQALAFLDAATAGSGEIGLIETLSVLASEGVPAAVPHLEELREIAVALVDSGRHVRVDLSVPLDFDYYSGVTWEFVGEGVTWARGGRYEPVGPGTPETACGLGLDASSLLDRLAPSTSRRNVVGIFAATDEDLSGALAVARTLHRHDISAALGYGDAPVRVTVSAEGMFACTPDEDPQPVTTDDILSLVLSQK